MASKDVTLDPEIADLVSAACDKSWQFVKTDPELAHVDMPKARSIIEASKAIGHEVPASLVLRADKVIE